MRPSAPASPSEPRRASLASIACLAGLLAACTGSDWPDRDPIEVRGAPVDTLEFLPRGSRFVLLDSLTGVGVGGLRLGYACTRILAFGLERESAPVPGHSVRLDYRLPADPDCPLDSGPRDTALAVRFSAADGPVVRLVDSLGTVFDSAQAVRGTLGFDSLELKGTAISAFNSRFFFKDTSAGEGRLLRGDSLAACERLNHAEYERKSDSLKVVRYSWVTLDPPVPPDTCQWSEADRVMAPLVR